MSLSVVRLTTPAIYEFDGLCHDIYSLNPDVSDTILVAPRFPLSQLSSTDPAVLLPSALRYIAPKDFEIRHPGFDKKVGEQALSAAFQASDEVGEHQEVAFHEVRSRKHQKHPQRHLSLELKPSDRQTFGMQREEAYLLIDEVAEAHGLSPAGEWPQHRQAPSLVIADIPPVKDEQLEQQQAAAVKKAIQLVHEALEAGLTTELTPMQAVRSIKDLRL